MEIRPMGHITHLSNGFQQVFCMPFNFFLLLNYELGAGPENQEILALLWDQVLVLMSQFE